MRTRNRNLLLIFSLFAVMVAAGPAGAVSSWHFDVLHGADLGIVSVGDPLPYSLHFDPAVSGDVVVQNTWLGVFVKDDHGCRGRHLAALFACDWNDLYNEDEAVDIDVAGSPWKSGPVPGAYVGEISGLGLINGVGDSVDVVVSAALGDLDNFLSILAVKYEVVEIAGGGGGELSAHMPEPGAATVFGVGTLLVAVATRRRRNR